MTSSDWIPVSERLPEDGSITRIRAMNGRVCIGRFNASQGG